MIRLGIRARRRWRALAMVTIATLAVTTLGACIPGGDTARSASPEVRLYTGPIPEPAELMAYESGAPAAMPEPPSDLTDEQALLEYQEALEAYLEAMQNSTPSGDPVAFAKRVSELSETTRNSDEASVAAWQSLLVASGIAVGHGSEAVEVSGMEGAGIPMTMAELRLHALLGASQARMSLTQLAQIIGGLGVFEEDGLEQALYDDLSAQLGTGFGIVFTALDPEVFTTLRHGRPRTVPIDEVTITAAQAALILRRLSVDLLVLAEDEGVIPAVAEQGAGAVTTAGWVARAAADGPCGTGEETPWEVEGRRNIGKGLGWGFGELVGKVPGFDGAKLAYQAAQAVLAIASLFAKLLAMQSHFSMGDAPLVRTKDRTAGERREIAVALSYPQETLEDVRQCLSALLGPLGIDLSDHLGGPASGVDVNFFQKNERLQNSSERGGTDTYHQQTGENGVATFPVLGKPQAERLPSGAEPEEVTARVRVDANIEGADLVKDMISAGWERLGKSVPSMLAAIAARMKLLSFYWDVPVRDWTLTAEFDVKLSGRLWSHTGINRGGVSADHCGVWTTHESTTGDGTVESSLPVRVTARYITERIEGEVISGLVFYPKGSSLDALVIGPDGGEVAYPQVSYSTTKTESSPGTDPMPPHYEEPFVSGCGDGDGSYTPPQPDCGARDYPGLATIIVNDGAIRVLADEPNGDPWRHCGSRFPFADPLAPPSSMSACASPQEKGGAVPSADAVFNESGRFEITGSLSCSRDGEGSLHRFSFDWTLTFCRVVEGKSDC